MPGNDLSGRRLYQPGLLFVYFVLGGLPLGCFAYGLNLTRRGQRVMGTALWVVASAAFTALVIGAAAGTAVPSMGILSVLVGIGVLQLETKPYKRAVAQGAVPAKWWPPMVGALGIILLVVVLMTLAMPEGASR
jgi:hypothetical protein